MEIYTWLLFASISFIATVTPGPAVLLATSHSAANGWRYSIATILGNISGLFLMSALSVLGLSAIILSSTLFFNLVKFAGALYLIYLGTRIWRNGFGVADATKQSGIVPSTRKRAYFQGLAVALSNPKAIAFTTALFPQFIDHNGNLLFQFSLLVATFMLLSFSCLVGYAFVVDQTKRRLETRLPRGVSKLFGAAFIVSGVVLANASPRSS